MKNKGLKQITNNKKTLKNLLNPNKVKKGGVRQILGNCAA